MIDTRKNNTFQLELFAFSTTSSTGARESETIQFDTPLLTNSYLPNNEGTAKFTPNLNLLALLKFLRKKENKSNERTTATYTVRLKVEYYSNTKALINSSVQDFSVSSGTWVSLSPNNIEISQNNVAFVKFIVLNPNSFPIFIDDWSIKESGKVILQENHYYPYGKEIVSLGRKGTPNHEFTFSGKEDNEEFGWDRYDFGARTLGEDFPRWNAVDPLAEKYLSESPYAYVLGNPIKFIDPDGMQVDVSNLMNSDEGLYVLVQLMFDLSDITGLDISYNNGMLGYSKNENKKGSEKARDYFTNMIDSKLTIKVTNDNSQGTSGGGVGNINLNSEQIDNNTYAISQAGFDHRTFSYGMSFLHESLHTATGTFAYNPQAISNYKDAPVGDAGIKKNPGEVEKILNEFREQLGTTWGQREDYFWLRPCQNCPKSMYWSMSGKTIGVIDAAMPNANKKLARDFATSIGSKFLGIK